VHRHEKGVDLVTQGSNGQRFHRTLFGYRRSDVDTTLDGLRQRVQELEQGGDVSGVVSRHLGELLTRFAVAVDEGERNAQSEAESLLEEAEERAAATRQRAHQLMDDARTEVTALFEEARSAYESHVSARRSAMAQLEGALGQMTEALAALASVPDFPVVPASLAVAKVDDALDHLQPELEPAHADLVA
jgi:uncharacterized protein YhaN